MLTHGILGQQKLRLQSGTLSSITGLSPYHYWLLDSTTTDHGSNNKPLGTNSGADIVAQSPFAEVTRFDATADYRRTTSTATSVGTNYTLGAWFRIRDYTDTFQVLGAHGDAPDAFSSREFVLGLLRNGTNDGYYPRWEFYHGGTRTQIDLSGGSYDVTDSDWHHLAAHRSSGKYRIWLDGQLVSTSDAANATVNNTPDYYYVGRVGGGGGSQDLDLAHYFQVNSELSDAQVAAIANDSDVGLTYPTWP